MQIRFDRRLGLERGIVFGVMLAGLFLLDNPGEVGTALLGGVVATGIGFIVAGFVAPLWNRDG
jgi:hypothetical protein